MQRRILFVALLAFAAARVNAQDVKLKEEKPGMIARAKVTFDAARATAQAKVPGGKLATAELEQEDGKLIYTLVFKTAGKKGQDEINVDALTGKIVAVEHEDDKEAKKEAKAEEKTEKKATKKGG
ncbi:MAG TPA: PepSY domain-containing protein [Gemmatimonadaceae bacterium]|nr:PepSY domain-containing protein [Gemmatimonadaceae bacterium]